MLKFLDPGLLLAMDPAETATNVSPPEVIVDGVQRGDIFDIGVFDLSSILFPFRLALGWILVSSIRKLWYLK